MPTPDPLSQLTAAPADFLENAIPTLRQIAERLSGISEPDEVLRAAISEGRD